MKLLIQNIMTPEQTKKFKYWQTRTIVVTMVGYALYYFVRKNFNTAMPSIEVTFGITKAQLGLFLTLNGIIYGLSRFINGFIADRVSARKVMSLGLALSALVNIGFGTSASTSCFARPDRSITRADLSSKESSGWSS